MEGEERGSESHWDLVGLRKEGGGGGMETGNQLLGRCVFLFFFSSRVSTLKCGAKGRERGIERGRDGE